MAKLTAEQLKAVQDLYKSGDKEGAIALTNQYAGNTTTTTPKTTTTTTTTTPKSNQSNMSTVQTGPANLGTTNTSTNTSSNYSNNNAKVGTGAVAPMPTQNTVQLNTNNTTTPKTKTNTSTYQANMSTKETGPANLSGTTNAQNATNIADYWNSLSYEEQQAKLKSNSALKQYIQKSGLVEKKPQSTKESGPITPTTTQKSTKPEWDYKDNSQARMDEIANNLDKYRVTNPELFDDYSTFYNFFINGKDRSQEQLDFLWNYYNKIKENNKYDNLSSAQVGNGIANGTIPESYMNDIKNTDPERVNEIKEEKKKAEDSIKNQAYLESLVNQTYDTGDSDFWTWEKKEMLYKDENNDGIEDRLYHEPTAEERAKVDRNFEIESEILDIDYTVKRTYEDLVERYPGAAKSTLMAMAQDRNNDLIRKKEDLLVEQTKLQGTIEYLQSERQEMDKAGQTTWDNIERDYGMYLRSPEGLAATTEAQYAATHIGLDEATTPTQQKIALESVLDGYYDKYGSIIQRPEQQVINDVMNYANKHGVSLSQALQENFIKPLQNKPEYATLSTSSEGISWTKIGEDADGNTIYGFVDTFNKTVTPYGNLSSQGLTTTYDTSTRGGKANTIKQIVSLDGTSDLGSVVSDIYNKFGGDNYGECGYLVNDYYKAVTGDDKNLITGTFDDRKGMFNKNTPSTGDIVLFDWNGSPTASDKMKTYGHVALVESVDDTGMWIVDANWDGKGTVDRRHINYTDDLYNNRVYGFYEIPESNRTTGGTLGSQGLVNMGYINDPAAISAFEEFNKLGKSGLDTTAKQKRAKELFELLGTDENGFKLMADAYWDEQNAKQAQENIKMIDNLIADIDKLPPVKRRNKFGTPNSYGTWRDQSTGDYGFGLKISQELWQDEDELAEYNTWASNYDQLMANLMYDKYQDIKSTGGTFGSMSNAEWDNLKQAATNLKFNQDAQTYYNNLIALRSQFENLADYGKGKQSTTQQKTNTMSNLMAMFNSY